MPGLHIVWQAGWSADKPSKPRHPTPPFPVPQQLGAGGEKKTGSHSRLRSCGKAHSAASFISLSALNEEVQLTTGSHYSVLRFEVEQQHV